MNELAALGTLAAAALSRTQKTSSDVDVRLRAGVVLRKMEQAAGPNRLLGARALEVLEIAGTAEELVE